MSPLYDYLGKMQEHFLEEEFVLRDSALHEQQVSVIEDAGSAYLRKYFSKNCGINDRATILEAPYFDVTKQSPQDIMHIFLEGIRGSRVIEEENQDRTHI